MIDSQQALLSQMTFEEKISLLAGADFWTTVPNERLGIPALKMSDGPNGVRGGEFGMGPSAACLPVGIALGSTWHLDLIEAIGGLLADEATTKGASAVLGPTINIHRSTLNGRNFECYSEDPYLASQLTVSYIKGLQAKGIAACPKHFVCNDSEFERYTMNSVVDERALREIYLPPFKAAVQEAGTWMIMSGYNKLNGTWCSENPRLLREILRDEWNFDGVVVSDWFGSYSSAIGAGGLDLEMPGPARWAASLAGEVQEGRLDEAFIDEKVRHLLQLLERTGKFTSPNIPEERADNRLEHQHILRQAATEAVVLLKHDTDVLPLNPEIQKSIAVIGASARWPGIMGGGSAIVPAHYVVTPLQALQEALEDKAEIHYEVGTNNHRMLPLIDLNNLTTVAGEQGFELSYYNAQEPLGEAAATVLSDRPMMSFIGSVHPAVNDPNAYALRVKSTYTADESGVHQFSLTSSSLARLKIDGQVLIDNWTDHTTGVNLFDMEAGEKIAAISLEAGQCVALEVECAVNGPLLMNIIRLGCLPPMPEDPIASAVEAAKQADVALVFVGTNHEWETEGQDQANMELPGQQNDLVEAVAAANSNTVVVLNTGSP
ncbi:MAG: glycoside hydrolase family 3 N-terminal domain-containing protein, partial [Deinococcota bacterium]